MKKSVLAALANTKYIEQAKQLFSGAYWKAGWPGDYLLLTYEIHDNDLLWFKDRGILVRRCESFLDKSHKYTDHITACKAYLFAEDFKRWDKVVYLDTDILVRAPISKLIEVSGFAACRSMWQTLGDNFIDSSQIDDEALREIRKSYDLRQGAFNSGVFAFDTSIIQTGTLRDVQKHFEKYIRLGSFGGDQLPLNLYFHKSWNRLPEAYNHMLSLEASRSMSPDKIQGVLIHLVEFGNGPWSPQSSFYGEWRESLDKAELIDLACIPEPHPWTDREIASRSRAIVRRTLLDDQPMTWKAIFDRTQDLAALFRTDFRAGSRKVREAITDVLGLRR